MGFWGTAAFDNDLAWLWLSEIEPDNFTRILSALKLDAPSETLTLPECARALAAAEVVAASRGAPAVDLPEEVLALASRWVANIDEVETASRALSTLQSQPSDLREYWVSRKRVGEWLEALADL